MQLNKIKDIDEKTALFKTTAANLNQFVLIKQTGKTREGFWYDVTIFWAYEDECSKREFLQAPHKINFLNDAHALGEALSDNVVKFPCNAEMGMRHGPATDDEKILLDIAEN